MGSREIRIIRREILVHYNQNNNLIYYSMEDLYIQAEAFISSMQQFEPGSSKPEKWVERLKSIKASIQSTGTYTHNSEELIFGAKLAWRNSNRCI